MELLATIRQDDGEAIGSVLVSPKTFGSGSDGFFGVRKFTWAGARWQAQVQLVRIGSKGEAKPEPEAA